MALEAVFTTRFKRDVKKIRRQGKNLIKFNTVARLLMDEELLPVKYKDHALINPPALWGEGVRDLHIEPDWLLIYRLTDTEVHYIRTGSHSELFG